MIREVNERKGRKGTGHGCVSRFESIGNGWGIDHPAGARRSPGKPPDIGPIGMDIDDQ